MTDADVVVAGAGAAGMSLAWHLVNGTGQGGRSRSGAPEVLLVEPPPGPVRSPERTWCFWEEGSGEFDDLLAASWRRLSVTDRHGRTACGDGGSTYKMLRSADFSRGLGARLASSGRVRRVTGTVSGVRDVPGGGEVAGVYADGRTLRLRGRWVFDSRPPRALPPARTTLLQHFRGWFLRTARPCFDPSVARLMDFRTRQPPQGLAFVYLLPLAPDRALVEYTVFSASVLSTQAYDDALRRYLEDVRPLGDCTVTATEHGVIPMTDGRFPRRTGRSLFRIGAAGGAVRPSTGYAFAALQHQAAAAAAALRDGGTPLPPDPHSWRHRTMDAVLLRALATGRLDGADFFADLFRRNPVRRVVRFLEGRSTPAEEWAIGVRAPVLPMLRTLGELPFLPRRSVRAPGRPAAAPGPGPGPGRPAASPDRGGAAAEHGEARS